MAKKIIPMKGKTGIISADTLEMLNKSIRNNYALFGDRADSIKAYCIRIKNFDKMDSEPFRENVSVSRYTISKDNSRELICKKDEVCEFPSVYVTSSMEIFVKNMYEYNISNTSNITDMNSFKYDDYVAEVLYAYCNNIKTVYSNVSFRLNLDKSIDIDAQTQFNSSSSNYNQIINYCELPRNKVVSLKELKEIKLVIIFTAVKSAPLIRVYDGAEDDNLDTVLDFEDNDCIFNSYYSKYDYYVEERKINDISTGIDSMKYDMKIDDISNYIKGERYIEDPIVYDIQYENENGFSAQYFERKNSEMVDGSYDIVKKYFYKGELLCQYILSKDNITGYTTFDERINITAKDVEEIEDKDSYISKLDRYIVPFAYVIDLGIAISTDLFKMVSVLKSKVDDRIIMYAEHIDCNASVKVETYHNNEYALLTFTYINDISRDKIYMIFDNDENVMFIHKSSYPFNSIFTCKRLNNNVKSKVDYFSRADFKDNDGNDVIKYNGIEGYFVLHVKGKTVVRIEDFNSPIYNINDDYIYIRDMYGVPEKFYIK